MPNLSSPADARANSRPRTARLTDPSPVARCSTPSIETNCFTQGCSAGPPRERVQASFEIGVIARVDRIFVTAGIVNEHAESRAIEIPHAMASGRRGVLRNENRQSLPTATRASRRFR